MRVAIQKNFTHNFKLASLLRYTRLVCEALIALPGWRELPSIERSLLFAAALLHDVAKPAATEIEADGRITSKGHVRQGAKMARQILWSLNVPFHQREAIVSLVQHGSLPLWFWDKPNPQRAVIKASQVIRCDLLALLAEADIRGRVCDRKNGIRLPVLLGRLLLSGLICLKNRIDVLSNSCIM